MKFQIYYVLSVFMMIVLLFGSSFAEVPSSAETSVPQAEKKFSKEELTQLMAPIALYPDQVLAQILMAATYPLELVMAERFMKQEINSKLQGDALDLKLKEQSWDTSVK